MKFQPDTGLDHRNFWQGLYTNRNSLAPLAAIRLLVGIRYMLAARAFGAGLIGACIVAMAGSGSRTSMQASALAVIPTTLPLGYRWLRNRYGSSPAALATSTAGLTVLAAVMILLRSPRPRQIQPASRHLTRAPISSVSQHPARPGRFLQDS